MIKQIEVYGTNITIPEYDGIVENWGTDNIEEQYWRRLDLPDYMMQVDYDKEGNALLNEQQRKYAQEEVKRCKKGFVFMSNGVEVYITGKNYFYLQWWKLEDDIYPDYRDIDRKYFLFLNHWENTPSCLGVIRGKKRREGATSVATSNIVYECIFFKNSFCGLTSKSLIDAKSAFTNMISFGYRQLPVFLKPKQLNNKDSVSELVFAHKSVDVKGGKGGVIDTDTGHRSRVDFRAPSLNAYDSGRLSRGAFDEGAKWAREVPFSTFISIVSKTLVKGVRRVGFIECPSTTNALDNGGAEFKIVWDNANQFKYERTPNRLVKYMTPAYEGYVGFIDKYGMSVVDKPTEAQYKYLVENFVGIGDITEEDVKLGAKEYLLKKRALLSGALLEEEIRMNPFDEEEMFMYTGSGCEFDAENIKKQIKILEEEEPYIRRVRLVEKEIVVNSIFPNGKPTKKIEINFLDDSNGDWYLLEKPNKENHFSNLGGYLEPLNTLNYQIGVDTTQDDREAEHGSKNVVLVLKKSCIVDGVEMGMYPVAMRVSQARLGVHFDNEVRKACLWYGCKANYECDRRTDFITYFVKQKCKSFLNYTPKIFWNPAKRGGFKPEIGSRSGDAFQLYQQLEILKIYFDGDSNIEYNGHTHRIKFVNLLKQALKYNHSKRTEFDEVVALVMALAPAIGEIQNPTKPAIIPKSIMPTFKLQIQS